MGTHSALTPAAGPRSPLAPRRAQPSPHRHVRARTSTRTCSGAPSTRAPRCPARPRLPAPPVAQSSAGPRRRTQPSRARPARTNGTVTPARSRPERGKAWRMVGAAHTAKSPRHNCCPCRAMWHHAAVHAAPCGRARCAHQGAHLQVNLAARRQGQLIECRVSELDERRQLVAYRRHVARILRHDRIRQVCLQ